MRNPTLLLFIPLLLFVASCKKDNNPPTLRFKTGSGYTSSGVYLSPGAQFIVGIVADKGSSDLNAVYDEVAYDGANVGHLVARVYLEPEDRSHYEKTYTLTARNQTGTERWIFNVNDGDGRITKQEIRVTVQ